MVNRQQRNILPLAATTGRPKDSNQSGLRVWHLDVESGQVDWERDFSELDVADDLKIMFAHEFARRLVLRGPWKSPRTAEGMWYRVRQFAKFCAGLRDPPQSVSELSTDILSSFASSNAQSTAMCVAGLFRDHPELPTGVRNWAYQRTPKQFGKKGAYTQAEMSAARELVFGKLARIESRIEESLALAQSGADAGNVARVLQALLLVPFDYAKVAEAHAAYVADSGLNVKALRAEDRPLTVNQIAECVFLKRRDSAVAVLAIILVTGWNLSSVLRLDAVVPQASPGNPDRGMYSITLDKRRRGNASRFESRQMRYVNAGARSDILTRAIRISAPTRAAMNSLPGFEATKTLFPYFRNGRFNIMTSYQASDFGRMHQPGMLSPARIRKTVNVVENRVANQNDEATHFSTYVMPDPYTRKKSASIIADGLQDALDDVHRFNGALAEKAPSSSDEAVLSSCLDRHSSPFDSDASGCLSSFLLCLACPNAVITPAHIPRLVVAWESLSELRTTLSESRWKALWAPTFSRLRDLKHHRISPQQWETGRLAISEADRTIVAQLLLGDLDVK